jgi:hypothetical protein
MILLCGYQISLGASQSQLSLRTIRNGEWSIEGDLNGRMELTDEALMKFGRKIGNTGCTESLDFYMQSHAWHYPVLLHSS